MTTAKTLGRRVSLLSVAAAAVLFAAPAAWACRGDAQYPAAQDQLAKLQAGGACTDCSAWKQELEAGQAMHDDAHRRNDGAAMKKSLQILDAVQQKLDAQ